MDAPSAILDPAGTADLGREVAVRDIDRELRRLWEADTARTKASLMNLVIFSERPGSLAGNSALTRELTREQACRAILVEINRTVPQVTTQAWLTAHCHLAHGRKSVCSEQIAFLLTGKSTGRMRNIVFSHLASDLPLVLWWQGELSALFIESLYGAVDRLIFDSAEWGDATASYRRIDDAVRETAGHLIVQDLEWTRSYALRVALAAQFDEPAAVRRLPGVREARIVHHPAHRNAALLLLSWFAGRCSWRRAAELDLALPRNAAAGGGIAFDTPGGGPALGLLESDPTGPPLVSFELSGEDFRLEISAAPGASSLRLRCDACGRPSEAFLPAGPTDTAALVADQLSRGGKNSLLLKVLPMFRELSGELP